MHEFPGKGRKVGVHVPPWNPLEGRPCEYYWRIFLWIMLLYLWMVLMEPALCNLLIFSPTIMSTMREDPVNTFMYISPGWKIQKMVKKSWLSVKKM